MSSLSARLLVSVSLLLLVFFGATIVVLEVAFREAGQQAQQDILDGQLMTILAAAEADGPSGLVMPPDLPEARFSTIGSGLYGEIRDDAGLAVWRSPSALGLELPVTTPADAGQEIFYQGQLTNGTQLMLLSLSVTWEFSGGTLKPYVFHVAASLDSFHAQIDAFRRQLFGWFAAVALVMLFGISLVLRSVLRPLRQVEEEISAIESGERQSLSTNFPTELQGVARNMNLLIGSERARSDRYRQTLDNLAHSLKTPLAAMRALLNDSAPPGNGRNRLEAEIERMNDIVRYQLRKPASLVGDRIGLAPVAINDELTRLADGLRKVYRDKGPEITVDVAEGSEFRGDRGDFMEVAGNLLDNACKWCRHKVHIRVASATHADGRTGIRLTVADDGAGIPQEAGEMLLERGMRLDESAPGHGIGLAIVRDIAASYGGDVRIARAELGGAELTVSLFAIA